MAALVSEREYQLKRWGVRLGDGSFSEVRKSIEEFVLYMEDYLHEARHQLSRLPEPEARQVALATLRKVVTMGVACFEMHGIEPRDPKALVINGRDGLAVL
jgi:hypothetical protein